MFFVICLLAICLLKNYSPTRNFCFLQDAMNLFFLTLPRPYLSLVDCLYIVTYFLEKKSFNLVLTVNLPRTAPVTIYTRNAPLWGLIAPPRMQVDVRSFQNIASHAFQDNIYWLQISRVPNRCVKWTIFGTCRVYGICERILSYW